MGRDRVESLVTAQLFSVTASGRSDVVAIVAERWLALGARGLEERDAVPGGLPSVIAYARDVAFAEALRRGALHAAGDGAPLVVTVSSLADRTWETAWTEHLRPVDLTPSVVVCPAGQVARSPQRRVLVLEARLVFGLGDHPTTRLAAVRVEEACAARPGGRALDFGAGTGVLAFVAVLAGAAQAVGVEIDAEALASATRNAEANGLAASCRFVASLDGAVGPFDVIAANVDALTIAAHAPALRARLAPDGLAVVTGFLIDDVDDVARALECAGFGVIARAAEGGWACVAAR